GTGGRGEVTLGVGAPAERASDSPGEQVGIGRFGGSERGEAVREIGRFAQKRVGRPPPNALTGPSRRVGRPPPNAFTGPSPTVGRPAPLDALPRPGPRARWLVDGPRP